MQEKKRKEGEVIHQWEMKGRGLKSSEKNFMYYYNFQNFQKFGELRIGIDVFKIKKRHQALKEKNS